MQTILRSTTEREVRGGTRKILGSHIKIVNGKVYKLYKYVSLDTGLRIICVAPNTYDLVRGV